MGHSTLLNITDVLALATPAHEVHPAHLGLGNKSRRSLAAQQCSQPADSALLK